MSGNEIRPRALPIPSLKVSCHILASLAGVARHTHEQRGGPEVSVSFFRRHGNMAVAVRDSRKKIEALVGGAFHAFTHADGNTLVCVVTAGTTQWLAFRIGIRT